MSNGEIKVSLKETARLAWEEFREAWSLEPGGIEYGWLYNVQGWTKGGRISQTAQQFMNDLWKYMRENHGEISVEEAVAQQVLARFSADWEEHFTREFLAAKIGKGNHKSEGVKNMHWRISTILQGLQPPRPTPAQQQPSASSSSAQSAGNAESSTSSPVDDIDIFLSGDLYTILGFSASNYKNVTRHDVLEAFKRMALKWHPDKNHQHGQSTAVATMVMQKLVEAKEVLGGNPEDKKMYDSKLSEKRRRATQFAGQNSSSDPSVKPVVFFREGQALERSEPSNSACAKCFHECAETSETILEREMAIPGTREDPVVWLEGRRDYLQHHIDRADKHMRFIAPTDTPQFSILGINMGNLNRHGQVDGYHHDNMLMTYCCGKFHLVLVAEARLDKCARMVTKAFNVNVFQSESEAAAIWILGNGTTPRCKTLVQKTVWTDDEKRKHWHLDYFVGEVSWGDHGTSGVPVTRCGIQSLRCGVAHLNNYSADKKREVVLVPFWRRMLEVRAQVVFGDFNKRAYLNIDDKEDRGNNTMKQWLQKAIEHFRKDCGIGVEFSMLRADAGMLPRQASLVCEAEDDTMLMFFLDYDDVDFKINKQHINQSTAQLDNKSLGLKRTDADWHRPILVHVRSSERPSGFRQRGLEAKKKRKLADNQRRKEATKKRKEADI